MFNKKTRRNFRQRKNNSSDEEDEQKDNDVGGETDRSLPVVNKPPRLAQSRGISCSSKRESTPPEPRSSDEEDGDTLEVAKEVEERKTGKHEIKEKTNSILSFSDDREGIFFCFCFCLFFKIGDSHMYDVSLTFLNGQENWAAKSIDHIDADLSKS